MPARVSVKTCDKALAGITDKEKQDTFEQDLKQVMVDIRQDRNLLDTIKGVIRNRKREKPSGDDNSCLPRGMAKVKDITQKLMRETLSHRFSREASRWTNQADTAVDMFSSGSWVETLSGRSLAAGCRNRNTSPGSQKRSRSLVANSTRRGGQCKPRRRRCLRRGTALLSETTGGVPGE